MKFQPKTFLKIFLLVFIVSGAVFCSANFVSAQYYTGACIYHSYQRCNGNNLYWYDSCGNQQDLIQYCQNGCYNNSCQNNNNYNNYNGCTQNSYERCVGNYLYWYDSCGNQEGQSQYCQNGCYNGVCENYNNYNNYNNNGNCTYHAYKLCIGNNIYWYDSCGNEQDLFQSCSGANMICQYGQCTYQQIIIPSPPIVYNNYSAHYRLACYSNSIYWYDSSGNINSLYKNCADTNSCTLDTCQKGKCSNTLECDGSTCAVGSADYNNYCTGGNVNNNNNNNANNNAKLSSLSVSFFAKPDQTSSQWQKSADVSSNSQIYFMVSVLNNSSVQVDNAIVSANIPDDISSLGNLEINGVQVSGDIISGVNIGSLASGSSKSVTFEGKTQLISAASIKQAVATVNVAGASGSDSVSINLIPGLPAAASVSSSSSSSGFWDFIKKWYLWILVGLVLIFLFIVVFRRLSSNE